jgi:hypothetical protein
MPSSVVAARTLRSFATASHGQVGVVKTSADEVKRGRLDARNLEKAVRHIHRDGLVVVEDVVPHNHLAYLNKKMVDDAQTLLARGRRWSIQLQQGQHPTGPAASL